MQIIDSFAFFVVSECRLLCPTLQAFFDKSPHCCHGALEVSAGGTVITAVRDPSHYATVWVVPHSVALGQQRCLTVQLRMPQCKAVAVGVLPVGHPNLSDDGLGVPGYLDSALSNGCSWYTDYYSRGLFFYSGKECAAPFGLSSWDEASAVVDRRTHCKSDNGNGEVRFLCNGKALEDTEPLPIGFAEEAVLVICFGLEGGGAKIICFE